ncbi:MAG TPA: GNAT family N-acetyltransferase [Prolixibacteraceae bacterium]|nr:GNAT family N-acetyltransferase [Prolixibacteraceae bacterium]HCR90807.1 GNAT family N-acetyltransferase [Prolixibacteraceae bacterium]HCU59669.1 GNAT family N-acetyltransferase [Prolixibacteraceae bacterium]
MELRTKRLLLRPIHKKDAESVFKYRSDSIANRYQGWIPKTIDEVSDFIDNRVSSTMNLQGTWFQFVIIINESGELAGDIGLHFYDPENRQVELGCTIDKKYQQRGFATEAMTEILNFLFGKLNKHRIIASIDPENISSIKLVEKLVFRREAYFKESLFINGTWTDDLIYAILRKEWREKSRN